MRADRPVRSLESGTLIIKPSGVFTYVARGWADEVLYVGMTQDLCARMAQHRQTSEWWLDAGSVTWELWPDRATARGEEARQIAELMPLWNQQRNPLQERVRPTPTPETTFDRARRFVEERAL